ncbi:protease-4 [Maribacter dokdonensis]|uniref:Protease-4 n=1 Tax=Maribacter dokdonensis TaxID=320912 RepID=A0ABY0UTE1_9FLAO|nr:S49 family peptidase [Maribacter dokdonensis]SDT15349.1 protease-4 [Maribacter dokdonensis]
MSSNNPHSIFSGVYLIHPEYAISFIPSLYKNFVLGEKMQEKTEEDKMAECQTLANNGNGSSDKRVAVINIKQPIQKFSSYYGLGSKSFINILQNLSLDNTVVGVVLDIDSGGGQVYGTGEFYDYLKAYPKPTVAYTDGYMCSAAYYLGNACNYIVANKRADHIGSIGAYASMVNFSGVFEKLGAKVYDVYSSKSPDKNSAYRALMNEGDDKPYIEQILDPIVETFHADMKSTRPGLKEETLKGGTWNGEQALEMGLIDENGNLNTAIARVFELADKNVNSNNMSKEYKNIEGAIGAEFAEGATENGLLLTEAEADAVENSLTTSAEQLTEAQNTVSQLQTDADNAATANTAIVAQANEVLELSGDAAVTDVAGAIAAYQAKINELGAEPGAGHTTKVDNEEEDSAHPYMNLNTPFYNKTKSLLN